MEDLGLSFDEAIILENEKVKRGTNLISNYTNKLVLTNRNLIYVEYNMLRKPKNIEKMPLNTIRTYNGRAQVSAKREVSGYVSLDVYFNNGPEKFIFLTMTTKEPQKWVESINSIINGVAVSMNIGKSAVESATEMVADSIASIAGTFTTAFNKRMNKGKMETTECPSCTASVKGQAGTVVVCPYCGRQIKL
ncbi:MAG: hypothetical protein Q4D29_05635 [Lachnospiraceae bacterium]|nr:hypothetical protein [Lachnospiraceae bacterium]